MLTTTIETNPVATTEELQSQIKDLQSEVRRLTGALRIALDTCERLNAHVSVQNGDQFSDRVDMCKWAAKSIESIERKYPL